jgi:hypothetical protein
LNESGVSSSFSGKPVIGPTFDVSRENMIPESDGIVDSVWFVTEKAAQADHCQYF